jgi:hypothetical protein
MVFCKMKDVYIEKELGKVLRYDFSIVCSPIIIKTEQE